MNIDSVETIRKWAEPLADEEGLFLVDVELKHGKVPELWILVDSEESRGILDACSRISRKLGERLEEESEFKGTFRLNVSSPGLSRPLSDRRQYLKNKNRHARVKYKTETGYVTVNGILAEVSENGIVIDTEAGKVEDVLFDSIVETKIIPKI